MRHSIEISGPGDHVIVSGNAGETVTVHRLLLTFSHAHNQAQRVEFKTEEGNIAGPMYVLDGEKLRYLRGQNVDYDLDRGQSLIISLSDGLSAAGMIEYSVSGQW